MNHEVVTFKNGASSLKQLSTGQIMHSAVGAETEAKALYFEPAKKYLSAPGQHVIWDVGMGTAANALSVLKNMPRERLNQIKIVSFENDPDGIETALEKKLPIVHGFENILEELLCEHCFEHLDLGYRWKWMIGHFVQLLSNHEDIPKADIIFYDFYSPKTCPELWSAEIFSLVKKHCSPKAVLFTYTSSTAVREALLRAGFFVGRGPTTEMKSETTQASLDLSQLEHPLTSTWLKHKSFAAEFAGRGQFA